MRLLFLKRALIALTLLLGTIQCSGGQEEQSPVSFSVAPGEPMIMNFDYPVSDDLTYRKSWFAVRISATNTSTTKTYTVMGFEFTVSGRSKSGALVQKTDGWVNSTGAVAFELAPGASDSTARNIIVDGLDLDPNYPMKVDVKVIGWEGTEASPLGRMTSEFRFSLR